jgi:quercetin dioxygenase-like cupin family protein
MKEITLIIIAICICFVVKAQYNKDIIVEPILKTDTTSIGQKIIYPNFQRDEVTISKITILPGKSTGWHKHKIPVFAYVLKGTLTVELENNKTMQYSENSSFSEVLNTFHNGINKGKESLVLIAFYMGEKGKVLSVPKETNKEK